MHWIPNRLRLPPSIDMESHISPRPLAIPSWCVIGQPQVYVERPLTLHWVPSVAQFVADGGVLTVSHLQEPLEIYWATPST
ncbi:MAG: hypothetical protein C7B46_03485 [Sulfobacillus benefaciens]|uniref:Uncharacterized protein n=1 Tax=Sulfobacillus benefaciens TaxID=453960 RepID=A0A2T2XJX3_9FIRM|nr:MAG: hypothetical protein C7B46_03485 [Sulfobacillus benefaciens]